MVVVCVCVCVCVCFARMRACVCVCSFVLVYTLSGSCENMTYGMFHISFALTFLKIVCLVSVIVF